MKKPKKEVSGIDELKKKIQEEEEARYRQAADEIRGICDKYNIELVPQVQLVSVNGQLLDKSTIIIVPKKQDV